MKTRGAREAFEKWFKGFEKRFTGFTGVSTKGLYMGFKGGWTAHARQSRLPGLEKAVAETAVNLHVAKVSGIGRGMLEILHTRACQALLAERKGKVRRG